MAKTVNVLIIDPDEARAEQVAEGVRADNGDQQTVIRQERHFELRMLRDFDPDMVIIACESPDRDMLEALQVANEQVPRPVVMFVDRSDDNATAKALEAGVHVYSEKPLAITIADGHAMVDLAAEKGLVLACGHQERAVFEAMGLYDVPERPLRLEAVRNGTASTRNLDVSVVLDLMIHDLDLAQSLAGAGRDAGHRPLSHG